MLIAPAAVTVAGYRLSVPNNAMDIVANAWCRGNESNSGDANPATHRAMKRVRPTFLIDGDAVHYLWPLPDPLSEADQANVDMLRIIARSVVALGWGIDLVVGNATRISTEQADALPGERWLPSNGAAGSRLRVPKPGTLRALIDRYECFLKRITPEGFAAPSPLAEYATAAYRRLTELPSRPVAAFSLLKLDASGYQPFDVQSHTMVVAGMMRFAAESAAIRSWPASGPKSSEFILGHGEAAGDPHVPVGPRRFTYIPLPSLEVRGEGKVGVGSIRRVMVTSFADGCDDQINWARRALSGRELIANGYKEKDGKGEIRSSESAALGVKGTPIALLSLIPENEQGMRRYRQPADTWATVTPVILPGFDDPAHYRRRLEKGVGSDEQKELLGRLEDRIEGLLRKAILQAGFPRELAQRAEIEWRKTGFWPGTDLADRYQVPGHLNRFSRYHVKICWRDAQGKPTPIRGPVCFGGGRFYGLGLFASI